MGRPPVCRRILSAVAAVLVLTAAAGRAERHLLQVEDFEGPWRRQTNIRGYLGRGFCTSNANPKVAATVMTTTVTVREPGRYAVYARAYTSPNSRRALQAAVGGKRLTVTHREKQRRRGCEKAGDVDLAAGPVEIAVHDADGLRHKCLINVA